MDKLNLYGQKIKGVYRSNSENNWALLITDRATYELKLGGVKPTIEKAINENAIELNVLNKTIRALKTDDFSLYFELENGECLIHSDSSIDGNGNIGFELKLVNKLDFDREREEWYDSDTDLKELK